MNMQNKEPKHPIRSFFKSLVWGKINILLSKNHETNEKNFYKKHKRTGNKVAFLQNSKLTKEE